MAGVQEVALGVHELHVTYGDRPVLAGVSFDLRVGQTLVVTGRNGSGKSTLLRALCGLVRPAAGRVIYTFDGVTYQPGAARPAIGLVAPDMMLYRELSGYENLRFFARMRGLYLGEAEVEQLLARVGLAGRGRDLVAAYSSGMQHRLRYAYAVLHNPPVLLLDEPTVTLDVNGAQAVAELIGAQRSRGLLVIATNDPREVAWGDYVLELR